MDNQFPRVSVVMSVYNGGKYLREAIDSILNQTFTDFEFIIIDDGSTDSTADVLDSYADPRIVLIRNDENIGLADSLNKGISLSRGKYIARMDADDIALPHRLEQQVKYLDENTNIGVVGTQVIPVDEQGNMPEEVTISDYPISSGELAWLLFFECCLAHPSVMMRQFIYTETAGYDRAFLQAEDYDLWLRVSFFTDLANLDVPLMLLRQHQENKSRSSKLTLQTYSNLAVQNALKKFLGVSPNMRCVAALRNHHYVYGSKLALEVTNLLRRMYLKFRLLHKLKAEEIRNIQNQIAIIVSHLIVLSLKENIHMVVRISVLSISFGWRVIFMAYKMVWCRFIAFIQHKYKLCVSH